MLPRSRRLTRGGELQAVRQKGKRFRTGLLEVRAVASPLCQSRVGFIVPRYKQSAVARNRVKRRLRELARLRLLPALAERPPADLVVWAAPPAYRASFDQLGADLDRIIRQLSGVELPALRAGGVAGVTGVTPHCPPGGRGGVAGADA